MKSSFCRMTVGFLLVLGIGCSNQNNPNGYAVGKYDEGKARQNKMFCSMADNAMLNDMSVADIHFMPHSAQLNDLGARRMRRYAELLADRGGTVYLDSSNADEEFNKKRMDAVMAYLADEGIPQERLAMASGLGRGRGIAAKEAIEVKNLEYDPKRAALTDLIGGGTGGALGAGGE